MCYPANNISLSIGLSNYQFYLPKIDAFLRLSFSINGDFIQAAIDDDINSTVDYDALCQILKAKVLTLNTDEISLIAEELKKEILAYSPLIKGGLLNIEFEYKGAVIKQERII